MGKPIRSIIEDLPDETEPSVGAEISVALAPIITEISASNEKLATMLAQSMREAIRAAESKSITVEQPTKVTQWRFSIEYKKIDGYMRPSVVTAIAETQTVTLQ